MNRVGGLQISPPFSQFSAGDSPNNDPGEFNRFPALPIGCLPTVPHNHLVALGNYVFDYDTKIRVSVKRRRQIPLRTIRARLGVARGVCSVLNVIRSEVVIGGIKVFSIYEFLEMPAYKCLVVLDRHNSAESRCF